MHYRSAEESYEIEIRLALPIELESSYDQRPVGQAEKGPGTSAHDVHHPAWHDDHLARFLAVEQFDDLLLGEGDLLDLLT